jgi:PAS domain S-box-containing protein
VAAHPALDPVCHPLEPGGHPLDVSPKPAFVSHADRAMMALLAIAAAAVMAAAAWYYAIERKQAEAAVAQELTAVADVQVKQIANWRRERIGDGRVMMAHGMVNTAARVLAGSPRAGDAPLLEDVAERLTQEGFFYRAALMDLEGKVRLLGPSAMDVAAARELVHEALERGDAVMSDLAPEPDAAHPMMHLAFPVLDRGALILDIDPRSFLYPYLQAWPGKSSSAESILVRREGQELVYLSSRRFLPDEPLFAHRALDRMSDRSAAAQDAGWQIERPDYRGVLAVGTARRIPDSPWYLICKIDLAEAVRPIKHLEWEMSLVGGLILLAAGAASALIWRNRRTALLLQREAWFRAVTNDAPAYLWMASPDGGGFINRPLAVFLGAEESIFGDMSAFVHPEDGKRVYEAFHRTMTARGEFHAEYRLRRWDGEFRWVSDLGLPRFSAAGVFLGYAGALEDVTEQRTAERRLRDANTDLAAELAERTRAEGEVQRLSARLIEAQEEERKRLARELHDDLNQQIAALTIAMGNLKRGIPDGQTGAQAQSQRIFDNLVRLSENVRRVSHQLHPAALQYSGLAGALREYCGEFGALTGIRLALRIEGAFEALPAERALAVYRIAQEALQNVAKHANAKDAAVELTLAEGMLQLRVSDEGVGIDLASSSDSSGLGLVSMKERARLAGGRLLIERGKGGGTVVTLTIPFGNLKPASRIDEQAVH